MPRKWDRFPDVVGDSTLATVVGDENDRRRSPERNHPVTRLVVHMTGATIVARAIRAGVDPFEFALSYYAGRPTSAHYLLGYDGELYQLTDDRLRAPHVGVTASERRAYINGSWARGAKVGDQGPISKKVVQLWRGAWQEYPSPQHLFPTRSINDCSVGVEMPPCGTFQDGRWTPLEGVSRLGRTRHTVAQHIGVACLAVDLADRWGWDGPWWTDARGGPRTPVVLGHEDVDLFGRAQASGGWDPGALRGEPYWDWEYVFNAIPTVLTLRQAAGSVVAAAAEMLDHLRRLT